MITRSLIGYVRMPSTTERWPPAVTSYAGSARRRLTAMMAISTPDGIAEQRFVRIGGVEQWIRGYWPIETRIHWVRDVTYDGDRSQIRTGTGPHVMAAVRSAAIGVLRLAGITNIAAASRHHARNAN